MKDNFVIGVDFGTDSVRAMIVDIAGGGELGSAIHYYRRWNDNRFNDPGRNQFRQHPLDYLEGLQESVTQCLRNAGPAARAAIRAISVDTTGSTPVAVDRTGTPLSLLPAFESNPNAMFVLWKDHTAVAEAAAINAHAARCSTDYLQFVGGIYSSEWYWAKLLHILRHDAAVGKACYSWVEHCDWIPFVLTGGNDVHSLKRSVCAAGHKALWAKEFGGLPPDDFFIPIDPLLKGFAARFGNNTFPADQAAGTLCSAWAEKLGLSTNVVVGVGAFDCHMGAVGGQIQPYFLSKVMGTSTCDMMVIPREEMKGRLVKGICGQVDGSIIPGMIGLEAGQSAFGDTFAWFRNMILWPLNNLIRSSTIINRDVAEKLSAEIADKVIPELSSAAARIPVTDDDELAIDWLNGRRTPDADQSLKGSVSGLTLGSDAPRVFKAWVEATCFGACAIVDRFINEGIEVRGLIGLGGVARKSPYIMQVMADVMNIPIRIHRSEQTCALGAAMFAATAAGIFPNVEEAMAAMGQGFDMEFSPNAERKGIYRARYEKYREMATILDRSHHNIPNEMEIHD